METDDCIECFKSTAMGTGRFVNRIPAGNDDYEGFMCAECASQHLKNLMIDFDNTVN